jgi:hypothetical protein
MWAYEPTPSTEPSDAEVLADLLEVVDGHEQTAAARVPHADVPELEAEVVQQLGAERAADRGRLEDPLGRESPGGDEGVRPPQEAELAVRGAGDSVLARQRVERRATSESRVEIGARRGDAEDAASRALYGWV